MMQEIRRRTNVMLRRQASLTLVWVFFFACLLQSNGNAQQDPLSTKISSAAPESCLVWTEWANPHRADAESSNSVDRMLAEADVSLFAKNLIDKLGKLPEALVPEDAPQAMKTAAATLGPQLVDALMRKRGAFFAESFELDQNEEPIDLKAGVVLEIGENVGEAMASIDELLRLLGAPMEALEIDGQKVIRLALPPRGPVREIGITQQHGCVLVGSSMEVLKEIRSRMAAGNVPAWLKTIRANVGLKRVSAIGKIDVAAIKTIFAELIDDETGKVMRVLGVDNVQRLEVSGGFDENDFVQRYAIKFDGKPSGIFDVFGDSKLTESDVAHLPEDTFFAMAMAVDGKQAFKTAQSLLVQLDPDGARRFASGLVELQSNTGIDLRETIEGLGPSFCLHNGFSDGILSGAMLRATIKDPAAFESTIEDAIEVVQSVNNDFVLGTESFEFNGKSIKTMRFGGVPVPLEPSWFFDGDQMTLSLFPSVLNSATNPEGMALLVDSESFAPNLEMLKEQSDESRVVGFAYSESAISYEILHGYACIFSAMGQNMIAGPFAAEEFNLSDSQFAKIQELLKDLRLPSCRSVVKHLTPQVSVLRLEDDALVLEAHSSLATSNIALVSPGIAIGMLLPAVQQVRAAARRTQSANNLRQLTLGALNYESAHLRFPNDGPMKPGGPAVSWRVKILPFVEQQNLYEQYDFDEPWDSENNKKLVNQMPTVFFNPNSTCEPGLTVYRGVGGEGGILGVDDEGQPRKTGFGSIVDGSSNTIFVLETPDKAAVAWTKPDGGIDPQKVKPRHMRGNDPSGFNVAMADGSVQRFRYDIDPQTFQNLLEMNDGNVVRWRDLE